MYLNADTDIRSICDSSSEAEVVSNIVLTVRNVGFDAIYMAVSPPTDKSSWSVIVNDGFDKFVGELGAGRLLANNPMPFLGLTVRRPFWWSEVEGLMRLEDGQARHMVQMLELFGCDGIGVPTFGPSSHVGFAAIGCPQKSTLLTRGARALVSAMVQIAFIRYCELLNAKTDRPVLSAREIEVVSWMALGKSNWTIAEIMRISPNTVNSYAKRIYAKLDVADRVSAVLRATQQGYIHAGRAGQRP